MSKSLFSNMKVKHIILSIVYIFITIKVFSQESSGNDSQENLFKIGGSGATTGVVRQFDNRYEGVKGSPFYFDNWVKGSIILGNGQKTENLSLKFNAHENELLMNQSKTRAVYIPKEKINSFSLFNPETNQEVIFQNLPHHKKADQTHFYKLLFNGEVSLYEDIIVVFEKADYQGGYSNDKTFDEFKRYSNYYYISEPDSEFHKLKMTSSGISKAFPNHSAEIKKFIKREDINLKNEKDLVKVFNYHQQLL